LIDRTTLNVEGLVVSLIYKSAFFINAQLLPLLLLILNSYPFLFCIWKWPMIWWVETLGCFPNKFAPAEQNIW